LNILNDEGFSVVPSLPPFLSTAFLKEKKDLFDLFGIDFDLSKVTAAAKRVRPTDPCRPVELCDTGGGTTFCVNSNELWLRYVAQDTTCSSCTINHCIRDNNDNAEETGASLPAEAVVRERQLSRMGYAGSFFYLPLLVYATILSYRAFRRRRLERQKLGSSNGADRLRIAASASSNYNSI